ncbi:SHOCT domain-containing protein [Nocardia gipuzkoensis]|uniref:SHOCT domain-containing protein n=1 Tax=Nocardia gipuzkoensis TaxID=2749991 RepID=UPI001E2C1CDB|nr:SHOCT domain-containing protein [Nocardia gipuzkoensis]UGT67790.1 SHOCT domain-containing protein [Nocardia gipuzkoensis]
MMYWYGNEPQWWMFVLMILLVAPLWIAVAIALVAVRRPERSEVVRPADPTRLAPEALLAERFASGDLDETEYRRRLAVLHPVPTARAADIESRTRQ